MRRQGQGGGTAWKKRPDSRRPSRPCTASTSEYVDTCDSCGGEITAAIINRRGCEIERSREITEKGRICRYGVSLPFLVYFPRFSQFTDQQLLSSGFTR